MERTFGRSKRGTRIITRLKHRSQRYTLIGAMGLGGMKAPWLIGRGMSQKDFLKYLKEHLIPVLPAGTTVVWDNLNIHKSDEVQELMKEAGLVGICQSRYSPDFNPIEKAWSKIKTLVRGKRPRGAKELRAAVSWAWEQITLKDIRGYFKHCGLLLHQDSPISIEVQKLAV